MKLKFLLLLMVFGTGLSGKSLSGKALPAATLQDSSFRAFSYYRQ